jgi:glutaredoxin
MKGFSAKKLMKSVNAENVFIAVLVIALVVLVVMYVNKNNEGFQEKPSLFFYNVKWCGYCKQAKDTTFDNGSNWASVKNKDKVNLVSLDCDEEGKKQCEAADVKGYPTIMLNGETFSGTVSPTAIDAFIAANLNN